MIRKSTGRYSPSIAGGETVRAFVPNALPPVPACSFSGSRQRLLEQATAAIGRLDSLTAFLPDPQLFLYAYVRREALLSSQIEGTQSSLVDLFVYEIHETPTVAMDDVQEVSTYIAALEHGINRLRAGFPLSNRLLCEMHALLMSGVRGRDKSPGEFRRSQNWIGGTRPGNARFVPPPPQELANCMAALEKFIHADNDGLPLLVRTAITHVQFETIHPFLDGNGRLGRLLIALQLHQGGLLAQPLLYLSLYFKQHRAVYYELLDRVRTHGDWEAWVDYFLEGVQVTATDAVASAQRIVALFAADSARLLSAQVTSTVSAQRAFMHLCNRPVLSVKQLASDCALSFPTANKALIWLQALGIVDELTGQRRDRLYAYSAYLAILSEGSAPI
jgi:Fic family protein